MENHDGFLLGWFHNPHDKESWRLSRDHRIATAKRELFKKHVLELYVFTSGLIESVLKPTKNTVQKCLENQSCWKIAQIITTNIKFAEHYF